MCRKTHLRGCLLLGFGIGLVVGYSLDSWVLCTCGGIGLVLFGLMVLRHK